MYSPIAFHCMSVLAQEPNFRSLVTDSYSNRVVHGVLSECLNIARRQNCTFPKNYISDLISKMTSNFPPPDTETDPNLLTTMYQDLLANRPLEFEVYLGNPVRMAEELGIDVPNLQALYAIARHVNKSRTKADARTPQAPPPRQLVPPRQSVQVNGRGRGIGPRSLSDSPNGRGRPNGHAALPPRGPSRQGSFEGDFDQFKNIVNYADSISVTPNGTPPNGEVPRRPRQSDYDIKSRELMLRERELQLREREIEISRRQGRIRHNVPSTILDDDEDEDVDDSRSSNNTSQRQLMMGGDNFDMMSVTGRRSRNKSTIAMHGTAPVVESGRLMSLGGRSKLGRSGSAMSSHATFDPLNENPLMRFTSNRYPGVDTRTLTANSRQFADITTNGRDGNGTRTDIIHVGGRRTNVSGPTTTKRRNDDGTLRKRTITTST